MRILHTADLHIGQIIYQHYERKDEHLHFFRQLEGWVEEFQPDLLIVAGDVFDVPQPSASCWGMFTEAFVRLRSCQPEMAIVIVAGNHDSASRLQSHSKIWALANTHIVGTPPPLNFKDQPGWEENFILRLPNGYVIMLPFIASDKTDAAVALQEYVEKENTEGLPVIMTGHLAVTGSDFTGHDTEIGMLRTVDIDRFGEGYDYLALGHIHRPQTINHPCRYEEEEQTLQSPVARYSGSALHVSCDEAYPHSVTIVDIDRRGGVLHITEQRIDQLRHFYNLPLSQPAFDNEKEIFKYLEKFIAEHDSCYIRLKVNKGVDLSSDFNNKVYALLEEATNDLKYRYNPKILWVGEDKTEDCPDQEDKEFAVEELQQMTDPLEFIHMTIDRYPSLNMDELSEAFKEIEDELMAMEEENAEKKPRSRKAQ
ncbi:MAG: exonuclease SbcCD subunit D [Muribaculaceae bacterium]|nr:exonuclease SbcCD subunit D [Muribaculaceae bacterium]